MQQLFQSEFLLSLGKAITSSIWQMGILFLIYQLLLILFRIKQASIKNFISSLFGLLGFAWFLTTLFSNWINSPGSSLVIEEGLNNNQLLKSFTGTNYWQLLLNWAEFKLNFIFPYLSIAYLFVLLWFCTKLLFQLKATNDLRTKGVLPVTDELQSYFHFLTHSLGISKKVDLYFTNRIDIPATFGFLKPIVLLPAAAVTHLTTEQLEAVLLHELAHIRRNDYFWNLLLSISETILFFNPFAQLLIGIARRERENSCDDIVMSYQQNAVVYAEALLNVEKARLVTPELAIALGDNKQHLSLRIKRILNLPVEKNKISTRLLTLLLFTVVFALMGWVLQQQKGKTEKNLFTKSAALQNKEIFYIKPDAFLTKDHKTIALHDEKRKLKLELKEEKINNGYVVWNEEGESTKFDKLIINDFPEEWIHEFMQPGKHTPPLPVFEDNAFSFQFNTDSTVPQQQKVKELAVRRLYYNQRNHSKSNSNTYNEIFNGWNDVSYFDSMFLKNNAFQKFDMYNWQEQLPFVELRESMNSDKMKQLKKKIQNATQLSELRKQFQIRKAQIDSAKKYFSKNNQENLVFTFSAPMTEEIIQQQNNIRIKVEKNQVLINNLPIINCADSVLIGHIPNVPQKRIRVLEVIKL